jgi:hypothetical protein
MSNHIVPSQSSIPIEAGLLESNFSKKSRLAFQTADKLHRLDLEPFLSQYSFPGPESEWYNLDEKTLKEHWDSLVSFSSKKETEGYDGFVSQVSCWVSQSLEDP